MTVIEAPQPKTNGNDWISAPTVHITSSLGGYQQGMHVARTEDARRCWEMRGEGEGESRDEYGIDSRCEGLDEWHFMISRLINHISRISF
jgi:hypothetical protein